jgi:hypothetical protein
MVPDKLKLTAGALAWSADLEPLGLEPSLKYKNASEANLKPHDSVKAKPRSSRVEGAVVSNVSKAPKTK